jgi:adenylosuccinate lyase
MNSAVGNYNAQLAGYPDVDWIKYSKEFCSEFGFDCELLTNQRGPKNRVVKLFQNIIRINNIVKDLNIDLWLYVMQDLVLQKPVEGHVGSSVMPHKINPWLIECSEGNIEVSNSLFEVFSRELQISRLQRDLSDHDLERNYGTAFSYSLVALSYTNDFLKRIIVNKDLMLSELKQNPKVLSEAYQSILRAEGNPDAYMLFKDIFRSNESFNKDKVDQVIDELDIDDKIKRRLKSLKVEEYIGHSAKLVDIAIEEFNKLLSKQ